MAMAVIEKADGARRAGGADATGRPPVGGLDRSGPAETLQRLRERIERYQRRRARRAGWTRRFVPTKVPQLDTLLPHGGLPCGAVTEILAESPGVGAMTLALRVAAPLLTKEETGEVCFGNERVTALEEDPPQSPLGKGGGDGWHGRTDGSRGRTDAVMFSPHNGFLIVVDVWGDFFPPAAARFGVPLDRLIVVRPADEREAFWAVDQSLRCPAVDFVIAPLKRVHERASRKLQLAAESSGAIGLILRPAAARTKSFAAVRLLIEGWHGRTDGWHGRTQGGHVGASEESCPLNSGQATPNSGQATHQHAPPFAALYEPYLARVTLIKVREGMPAGPVVVDLHHETDALPLHSLPVDRPVVQTGS